MRFIRALSLALIAMLLIAIPVLATDYRATYTITETNGDSYTMLPVIVDAPSQWLADNGFMTASALDTRVETLSGLVKSHLVADDKILTAVAIPANSQTNLYFTTGNSIVDPGYMSIITGYGGYITTADGVTEPGNSFTIEVSGYFDTSSGSDKCIVNKAGSLVWYVSNTSELTARIFSASGVRESNTSSTTYADVYGVNWFAQTFQASTDYNIASVDIYGEEVGTVSGNATVQIRTTSAGLPTSTVLASGSVLASSFPGAPNYVNIALSASTFLTSGTTYAAVFSVPSGTSDVECIRWYYSNANPYANGQEATSTDSGASWSAVAANDMRFRTYGYPALSIVGTGITTGTHVLKIVADTTNFKMYDGGVEKATTALGAVTAYDSDSDFIFCQNNVSPYQNYIKYSAPYNTLLVYYQPITIIGSDTLPDREGATQDGTITWGSNPAGVTVTLGGLISVDQPTGGETAEEETPDRLPVAGGSDWFVEPDVGGALLTNPLRPFVTILSDTTTLSELQAWRILGLAFVLGLTMLAIRYAKNHLFIAGVAACGSISACIALTIFPLWTLVFAIGAVVGGLVAERSPSL